MDDNKVAVLLEDLKAQFRTFGEGLEFLQDEIKEVKKEITDFRNETNQRFLENHQEHQLLIQMVKELDTEVVKMKRVK
jgi:prefoldin subunit 5